MHAKRVYKAISIVSLAVMLTAIAAIIYMFLQYQHSTSEYLALAESVREPSADRQAVESTDEKAQTPPESAIEQAESEITQQGTSGQEQPLAPIPINFNYLTSQNSDIIAWIEVEGTTIDYPVLYDATMFRYYLNHSYTGAFTFCGSVFVLGENASDFRDFNTVVYGHNLLNGKMFAPLHNFEKQAFFDENKNFVIYTPNRILSYRIFAAYKTDNLDQIVNFDYSTPEARQDYIDQIYTHEIKAIFDPEVTVTPNDRIVTLSTCVGNPAYRYLVQGVLIEETEGRQTEESGG